VPDDSELDGLDPVALMEQEANRIESHLRDLPADGWDVASRCEGWTVGDVVRHLAATEDYHQACLDGRVADFLREMSERGGADVAGFNAVGIDSLRDVSNHDLIARWSRDDTQTRDGFRERGDGEVDTSVGMYPARWQAFHLAGELATHADDMFVPVPAAEERDRLDWRVRFSRFSLEEAKPDLAIERTAAGTRVRSDLLDVELGDVDLVEAVAGRATSLDPGIRALLSTMP
jgi:uncharacterized protein (TIGR03083 family)